MLIQNNPSSIQYPLNNDIMFALVMNDADLWRGLLERIFPGRKVRMLKVCDGSDVEVQNTIITGMISKSVRLDVLFEDDDSLYSIEMQNMNDAALPMRGRYYASAMDIDQLRRGEEYKELKKNYVIFICTFDHYGLEQAVYSFQNYDVKNSLPYGDESFKLIVNTTAPVENTPQELMPFFDYVNRMEVPEDDAFIQALHAQVEKYNTSEWRRKLMTLEEKIKMEVEMAREQAFKEGELKGKSEGKTEGKAEGKTEEKKIAASKMKTKGFDAEDIADITDLTLEEIKHL